MTIADIKTMLEGITGFSTKVVYYAWPDGQAPELPFICYFEDGTNNFFADSMVFHVIKRVYIEFYSEVRDLTNEGLIETALNNNNITWERELEYVSDERCWVTTYSIEV